MRVNQKNIIVKNSSHKNASSKFTNSKYAFSVIEIGIVVIIIGVLIAGIISASSLIKSSKTNGFKHLTSNSVVAKTEGLTAWYETSLNQSFITSQALSSSRQINSWKDINASSVNLEKNILTSIGSNITLVEDTNSQSAVRFNGLTNFTLTNFFQGSLSPSTIFLVIKPSSLSNASTILDSFGSNPTHSISITSSAVILNAGNNAQSSATNAAAFIPSAIYIICVTFNKDSSRIYINDANSLIGGSVLNVGENSLNGLTIGSNKSGGNNFSGDIYEIIIFNKNIQLQDRREIFKYLANKYQINVKNI